MKSCNLRRNTNRLYAYMKILYIHGLDSSPNPQRISYMQDLGHETLALHLDYRKQPDAYHLLHTLAREEGVKGIVGSSLGGCLGFWLGEDLGLPCLLFNPAMWLTPEEIGISADLARRCPKRYVVLGDLDERVNPDENWAFFALPENQAPHQRVIRSMGLGHQIDALTFEETFRWAIGPSSSLG